MLSARILTTRNTTFDIDVLEADEADQIGAVRIVRGNLPGLVKAIIVGNDDMHRGSLGPMASGDTLTSTDPRFLREVERALGAAEGSVAHAVVDMHDRYETPAQYAILSS